MGKGFPGTTPNPSYVTTRFSDAVLVPTGTPAVLSTAPEIKGGDVPKKIDFCCVVTSGSLEFIVFHLFRDGSEIQGPPFFGEQLLANGDALISMHWVDESPGKGKPVYDVRADGTTGDIAIAGVRSLTVHNI